jgi:O-acetyl-ADP-ribose deacetylase
MKIKLLTMLYVISTFCLLSGMAPSLQNLATDIDSLANAISGKAPTQKQKEPSQQPQAGPPNSVILNGITIEISQGNLVTTQACAIVNAANSALSSGGALSGAIFKAAGPKLVNEIQERKQKGELQTPILAGDAAATNAHNLKTARYIIHAVGPDFSAHPQAPIDQVGKAYIKSLELADELSCDSIALPPLSAGLYRGTKSLDDLARETFMAIKAYVLAHPESMLKQIMLITYTGEEFNAYKSVFDKIFKAQQKPTIVPPQVQPKQPAQQVPVGGAAELIVSGKVEMLRNRLKFEAKALEIAPPKDEKPFTMFTIKGPSSTLDAIINHFANQAPTLITIKAKNFQGKPSQQYTNATDWYATTQDVLLTEGKQSFIQTVNNLCRNQCSITEHPQQLLGATNPTSAHPVDPQEGIALEYLSLTHRGKTATIKSSRLTPGWAT